MGHGVKLAEINIIFFLKNMKYILFLVVFSYIFAKYIVLFHEKKYAFFAENHVAYVCVENVSHQKKNSFSDSSNYEFCFEHNKNLPIKISTFNPPAADGGHAICYAFGSNAKACCC